MDSMIEVLARGGTMVVVAAAFLAFVYVVTQTGHRSGRTKKDRDSTTGLQPGE